jgi:YidC/Oxa1 family membrane protein insertase
MTSNWLRVVLWGALILVLYANFIVWQRDYGALSEPAASARRAPGAASAPPLGSRVPQIAPMTQSASQAPSQAAESAGTAITPPTDASPPVNAGTVHVRTDVLDLEISLQGGTLVQADLPAYPRVKGRPEPVRLLNHDGPDSLYELQSGLAGPGTEPRPTHLALFASARRDFVLASGQEQLHVPLTWTDDHITVIKDFVFRRGGYRIDLKQTVVNHSDMPWEAVPYAEILRNDPPTKRTMFNVESYAFHGPAIHDGTKYRPLKIADTDDQRLSQEVRGGWLAGLQHHFTTAIVPPADASYRYTLSVQGNEWELAAQGARYTVAPGATEVFPLTLFVGPKLQAQLAQTGPELQRVADYGHLYILAKPLFWLLERVYALFHNWGVAIITVTFLLKLVFYPLSEASGKSMAKMKALAPRIKSIQETYKDDREKSGRAMMELYQREKINPVAGCLPIIVQIPVFLAFYWVLLESVEMRQAPFFGWINDLSSKDPFFILPAIMAGAMFVQYKLNPAPADPVQAKVMMIVPLVMSVTFAFFPAGLVLYWVTNTLLSIAQTWNINRRVEAAAKKN